MSETLKIGIIGTGAMGKNHLRVVYSTPGFQLTCAADIDEETVNSVCVPYPVKQFINYRDMVDEVDAVMVSTPTISHYEISKFFLENRKHVLVEKPMTQTLEEADELIKLAEENRVTLAVGHLERFNPAVEFIRPLVKRPLFIEVQRLGSFSQRSLDVDVIMDLMIHDLDIILHWDNSGIKQINASGIPIVSTKIDIANVRLQFNSNLVANITASRVSQKKTRKLRIFQKHTYFSLDYQKRSVKMFRITDGNLVEETPEITDVEPLRNLWANFHKSITSGINYNVTGQDGRSALELAIRISNRIQENIVNIS